MSLAEHDHDDATECMSPAAGGVRGVPDDAVLAIYKHKTMRPFSGLEQSAKEEGKRGGWAVSEREVRLEMAAAFLAQLSATLADAVTAQTGVSASPCSLRCTAAVLIAACAAPCCKRTWSVYVVAAFAAALAAVGLAGLHVGDMSARASDAAYVVGVGVGALVLQKDGGDYTRLVAAQLLYVGTRQLRTAYDHHEAVLNFNGPAHASVSAVASAAFGGTVGVAAAIVHLFTQRPLRWSAVASLQCLAALMCTMSFGEQTQALHSVYGPNACVDCPVAVAARRLAETNTPAASLWASAFASLLLSDTRASNLEIALIVVFFVVAMLPHVSLSVTSWNIDVALPVLLTAVLIGHSVNRLVGAVAYIAAYAVRIAPALASRGFVAIFQHLTHVSNFLIALLLLTTVALALFSQYNAARLVAAAGSSIAVALYQVSVLLMMSSEGVALLQTDPRITGSTSAITFVVDHFVPLFAWLPLRYACTKHDSKRCTRTEQAETIIWLATAPTVTVVYFVALTLSPIGGPPSLPLISTAPAVTAAVGVMMPWMVAAFGLPLRSLESEVGNGASSVRFLQLNSHSTL